MKKVFSKRCVKITKTAALYLSFFGLGLCVAIPGPTLLDLQHIVNTETSKIAFIYLARSSSALAGSLLGGVLFDLVKKRQLLLTLCNFLMTIGTLATPWSRSVNVLIAIWCIAGFALGAIDTGSNVMCLNLWGKESAPYFQALHFLFGVGGFIAPLIAEPFLSKPCLRYVTEEETASNFTLDVVSQNNTRDDNGTYTVCDDYSIPPITYAYSIIAAFIFSVTVFLLILAIMFPDEEKPVKKTTTGESVYKGNLVYTITVAFTAQLVLGLFCGIEIGYGQMIATFCVKGDLKLSKSTASFITALFWGTFTFGRGVAIYLSSRFSPFTLVFGNMIATVAASAILLIYGSSYVEALWAGTLLLALGVASLFPSVITWVELYIHVNNKIYSVFVVSAAFGEMVLPLTVSQFIESQPHMLMFITLGCSVGGCVVTFCLWLLMNKKGPKK